MELTLGVKEYRAHGKPYYRLLIPKKISNHLGLQKDDKVCIQFKEIIRNGSQIVIPEEINLDGKKR